MEFSSTRLKNGLAKKILLQNQPTIPVYKSFAMFLIFDQIQKTWQGNLLDQSVILGNIWGLLTH